MAREYTPEELKEALEHRDVLLAIRELLVTKSGHRFFKFLFDKFSVANFPELELDDKLLREQIGYYRAGHSIFKIVSEANAEVAGALLAEIEKERYDQLLAEFNAQAESRE